MYEIIWHGRGGQGVVIAAQILAEAAYLAGFRGVTSAPTFGPERRGAPVTASTRIAEEPIRTFSQLEKADITVVLDDTLFQVADIWGRSKPGGMVVINTAKPPEKFAPPGGVRVALVDGASIALKHHLVREGAPVVNTPMLGAFARATELVTLDNLEMALGEKLSREAVARNFATVKDAWEETRVMAG
jgi:2-oxoacid:acceptor oxidoreductase gamma subunit (pyruvate/2-ketoisovalerate family)